MGILWLERLGGLSVALGLLAAGAAFAMREVVASAAGWLLITSGRAYMVGDRIEMGGIQGDVIGFGILRTTLMEIGNWVRGDQYTGRTVTVSNAVVFQQPIYNYTRYFRFLWDELGIPITFASNVEKAQEIALAIANKHTEDLLAGAREEMASMARHFNISAVELMPAVFVSFDDNWVELSLRFLTEARVRRRMRHQISQQILAAFSAESDIQFASETMSVTVRRGSKAQ
jgi:small-conductance mechanosensitive channel